MRNLIKKTITTFAQSAAHAALAAARPRPTIIAITGNVGKTTTKDTIAATLQAAALSVRKSPKTYNSELGVPLSVLGLSAPAHPRNPLAWLLLFFKILWRRFFPRFPSHLVLEVGTDRPGDIQEIVAWLPVDIAVLTALPEYLVHQENFPSKEALIAEKRALLEKAAQTGGICIGNYDDAAVRTIVQSYPRHITYGEAPEAHVRISPMELRHDQKDRIAGMAFELEVEQRRIPIELHGVLSEGYRFGFAAAAATLLALQKDLAAAGKATAYLAPVPGRMRILSGKSESIIIDDTYNSSPAAALAALQTLSRIAAAKRIAVLGDMKELGADAVAAHKMVGEAAAAAADIVVLVGPQMQVAKRAAEKHGGAFVHYWEKDSPELRAYLSRELIPGTVILFKASQSMRFERLVAAFLANPADQKQLVRQEPAWRS